MAKITKLTAEQAARLPVFRAEYLSHGISTVPADRLRAETAFAAAYRCIGRDPVPVIWVPSPLSASILLAALKQLSATKHGASLGDSLGDSLRDSLWDSLGDSLRASLVDSLGDSLVDSLGDSLRASLVDSLGDSLVDSLGDSLRASLRASLVDSLGDSLVDSLGDSLWDSLRASLGDSLVDSLGDSLGDSLVDSLGDSLRASLVDSLGDSLVDSLGDSLWDSLRASLGDSLVDSLGDSLVDSLGDSLRASLVDSLGDSLVDSLGDSLRASLGDSLGDSLVDSLGDSLWDSLRASLGDSLRDSLRASLGDSLGDILVDSLRASLVDSLGDSLWDSLVDSLRASLGASLRASLGDSQITPQYTYWLGQQDLYWIAFYKFCAEIGVLYSNDAKQKLEIMHDISMSCGWWYPRDGVIVACDRPSIVKMDERSRIHDDTGPAVAFRDGWKIYAVHGVRVPAWVIENPERLTIETIGAEPNTEIQRVMIERYGWDRYATESGATVIDHDERWGTLMKAPGGLFLRVVNRSPEPDGTFRNYILPVADGCEPLPDPADPNGVLGSPQSLTALNAVASTFGLTGREYAAGLTAES